MKYTAAIIGLGRIGLGYDLSSGAEEILSHSKAFMHHPGFELVGGVDPDGVKRAAFEQFTGVKAWTDVADMLDRLRPQVVAVASPTHSHMAMVELAVAHGPLAILCEKPLATMADEGQRMVDLCRQTGVLLGVNYMRRFDPALQAMGRELRAGLLGEVYKGTLWYSKGLLHNGSHYLDLLLDWLGPLEDFDILDPGPTQTLAGPEPDVVFRFASGCRLYALAAREERYSLIDLDLVGTSGRLRYANLGATLERWTTREDPMFPGYTILDKVADVAQPDLGRYQWHVAEGLFQALAHGIPLPSTAVNGLLVLSLCDGVRAKISSLSSAAQNIP
jgi:predicted dehydrogenase